ncbi:transglycosylase domain-containing protein [Cohnella fermenti]|uniref:Glycosyl transferase family 51 domain-containing protein n=1 Tax=Cohnella fermenti TaxID=2565925 RepID=A0A4S4CA19_9BACL|nr:transglycosylase domain-containing protein [Cohnella fermenti]THF84607.1 hypothetical protein E6C55_01095 [Cohnella fermenti]
MFVKLITLIALFFYKEQWEILYIRARRKYSKNLDGNKRMFPYLLIETLIIAEDKRFYKHYGFDPIAIVRALQRIIFYKKLEGASTITQQLVRTLLNDKEITIKRKVREIFLSVLLEVKLSKTIISELYLYEAYFGWKMNGIQEACLRKNYNIWDLNLEQSIALIARLKYPEPRFLSDEQEKKINQRESYLIRQLKTWKESNHG